MDYGFSDYSLPSLSEGQEAIDRYLRLRRDELLKTVGIDVGEFPGFVESAMKRLSPELFGNLLWAVRGAVGEFVAIQVGRSVGQSIHPTVNAALLVGDDDFCLSTILGRLLLDAAEDMRDSEKNLDVAWFAMFLSLLLPVLAARPSGLVFTPRTGAKDDLYRHFDLVVGLVVRRLDDLVKLVEPNYGRPSRTS